MPVVRPPLIRAKRPKTPRKLVISEDAVAAARIKGRRKRQTASVNPFAIPPAPPWVPKPLTIAQDASLMEVNNWAVNGWAGLAGQAAYSAIAEGLTFLGYPYLAELAQRAEYRMIVHTLAEEMTRKWVEIQATGDTDKSDQIAQIESEFKRLKVKDAFYQAAVVDGFFGRSHLYLDFDTWDDRDELKTPIGIGTDLTSQQKVGKKNPLKYIKCIEPIWVYPTYYDSTNPLREDYYKPTTWYVQGLELHGTRLLTFISNPVSDILKPVYYFGGLATIQMAKPYVENFLHTRQNVQDLIASFSVFVLSTDLEALLNAGGQELFKRAEIFNDTRDNQGLMMTNKDTEELTNISVPLGTLDTLQAQSQEHIASVSGIPLVKLLGISPHGLNASSEGEIRVFYDKIHARQEMLFDEPLRTIFNFVQLSLFGFVDPELDFTYVPLWSLDEEQLVTVRKTQAETAQVYIDTGVLSQLEVRRALADDPDSPYEGLDVDDVPDLKGEEEEGLEPRGARRGMGGGGGEGGGSESHKDESIADIMPDEDPFPEVGDDDPLPDEPIMPTGPEGTGGYSADPAQHTDHETVDNPSEHADWPTTDPNSRNHLADHDPMVSASMGAGQIKRSDKLKQLVVALEAAATTRDPNSRYRKLAYLLAPREHMTNDGELSRYQKLARLLGPDQRDKYVQLARLLNEMENNTNYGSRYHKLGQLLRDRPKNPDSRHAKLGVLLRQHNVDPNSRIGKLAVLLREHQVDPDSRYSIVSKLLSSEGNTGGQEPYLFGGEELGGPHPEQGEDDVLFDWEESQHPRAPSGEHGGEFTKGGQGGGGAQQRGIVPRIRQAGANIKQAHGNFRANATAALNNWRNMGARQRLNATGAALKNASGHVAHHVKEHFKEEAHMYKHAAKGIGKMAAGEWYGRLPEHERKAIKKALVHVGMTAGSMLLGDPTGHTGEAAAHGFNAISNIIGEFALEHAHHAAIMAPAEIGYKTAKHAVKHAIRPHDSAFDAYDIMGEAQRVAALLTQQIPDQEWADIFKQMAYGEPEGDENLQAHGQHVDDLGGVSFPGEGGHVYDGGPGSGPHGHEEHDRSRPHGSRYGWFSKFSTVTKEHPPKKPVQQPTTQDQPWAAGHRSGVFPDEFKESEHHRGQPGNSGQFGPGGGAGGAESASAGEYGEHGVNTGVRIQQIEQRVWSGKPVATQTTLGKQDTGKIGEAVVLAFLKSKGLENARLANTVAKLNSNNFAVDVFGDHTAIEVKTAVVSSTKGRWAVTLGQFGKEEQAFYNKLNPEKKKAYNLAKLQECFKRKDAALKKLGQVVGHDLKPVTMMLMINPDTKSADLFQVDGYHANIGYNSPLAKQGYVGSYQYAA